MKLSEMTGNQLFSMHQDSLKNEKLKNRKETNIRDDSVNWLEDNLRITDVMLNPQWADSLNLMIEKNKKEQRELCNAKARIAYRQGSWANLSYAILNAVEE